MRTAPALLLTWLAAASLPAMAGTTTATDTRIPALLDQLAKVRPITAVALSPDGHKLAWVVETHGKPAIQIADADGSYVHDVGTAKPGSCRQDDIAWSPDSRQLAFLSDCDSNRTDSSDMHTAIFVVDSQEHAAPKRLLPLAGYAHALSWTADGSALGFLYVEGATRRATALAAAKPAAGEIGVDGMEIQRVARLQLADHSLQLLTPADSYVYEFSWSPDAQRIAYVAAPAPGDNNWWVAKLYVQATQSGAAPALTVDPGTVQGSLHGLQIALPRWSPDSSRIAFIGGLMSDQGATGGDIYSVGSHGGTVSNLTPGIHVTPAWFAWNDTQSLRVSQFSNGQVQLADYAISADQASQQRVLFSLPAAIGDGSAELAVSLSRDGKQAAFMQSSYTAAPEVHAGALDAGAPAAVTTINAALKSTWGKTESVEWEHEGFHVQGWLLYPVGYDPKKSYPLIVSVHGGPSSVAVPSWPNAGYGSAPLSALGYFVLIPNPRGSYGQGEAYVQANRKDFGYGDLRDILAGVDTVEKKLPVDDRRLGLTGWSYGGFMTMFAVSQTQRFHAAVAGAGIANWQSYYGENLIDQWMTPFFGTTVYEDPTAYAKSSAINFIKQVKTPTLVVVGDRDAECPAPQSFEFWHALRAQHVPTSLVVYPNEGHHFEDPAHQRDVLQRALSWFQQYLPAST